MQICLSTNMKNYWGEENAENFDTKTEILTLVQSVVAIVIVIAIAQFRRSMTQQ